MKETREYSPEDRVYCFINKCDQGEDTVIPEEHCTFLEENRIQWFRVSAKSKYNVNEAIMEIAREIMKTEPKITTQQQVGLAGSHQRAENKGKCCN